MLEPSYARRNESNNVMIVPALPSTARANVRGLAHHARNVVDAVFNATKSSTRRHRAWTTLSLRACGASVPAASASPTTSSSKKAAAQGLPVLVRWRCRRTVRTYTPSAKADNVALPRGGGGGGG